MYAGEAKEEEVIETEKELAAPEEPNTEGGYPLCHDIQVVEPKKHCQKY